MAAAMTFVTPPVGSTGATIGQDGKVECQELLKCAYGMKSAPPQFQKGLRNVLVNHAGLNCSKIDPNVYYCHKGNATFYCTTHVDDLAVVCSHDWLAAEINGKLSQKFDLTTESMDILLGMNVTRNDATKTTTLHMTKYLKNLSKKFGYSGKTQAVPASVTMATDAWDVEPTVGSSEYLALRPRAERFRSLVPSCLYAITCCRPEAAYAVGKCCQHLDNPGEIHLQACEQLFEYLVTTADYGITYRPGTTKGLESSYSPLKEGMFALSDSKFSTGRSTSGNVTMYNGGAISWTSKRQPVTSLSSAEAEYYAASSAGQDIVYFRHLFVELGMKLCGPTTLKVDNSACVKLAQHFESFNRAKHIDRRVNFLTDYENAGLLKMELVSTHDNCSDIFTKPLAKEKFGNFRRDMGISAISRFAKY